MPCTAKAFDKWKELKSEKLKEEQKKEAAAKRRKEREEKERKKEKKKDSDKAFEVSFSFRNPLIRTHSEFYRLKKPHPYNYD